MSNKSFFFSALHLLKDLLIAKAGLETSLTNIFNWLTKSGLQVNRSKTEICNFFRVDKQPINFHLNGTWVQSKTTMNVLGVIFDSKLQWGPQVSQAVTKANRALYAIKLIRRYFSSEELLNLVTANFYSVLFYNSEVWHINTLHQSLHKLLMSTSAKAIKICLRQGDLDGLSYEDIHQIVCSL